jgi:hypothetical protein
MSPEKHSVDIVNIPPPFFIHSLVYRVHSDRGNNELQLQLKKMREDPDSQQLVSSGVKITNDTLIDYMI